MRTKTAPWDYQRRPNIRDSSKEMAVYFDARDGRKPMNFDKWPVELRLAWYAVRKAYVKLEENKGAKRNFIREIHGAINILTARFGIIFDCYWAGYFNEPPEYYAALEADDRREQQQMETQLRNGG